MRDCRLESGRENHGIFARAAPVWPHGTISRECGEHRYRVQNAIVPRLPHRLDHHDVTERARRSRGACCRRAVAGALFAEEIPTVDVVRQERRGRSRGPRHAGVLMQVGENLRAGVPASHDDDALASECLRRAIARGMKDPPSEHVVTRHARHVRRRPRSRRADHGARRPASHAGIDDEALSIVPHRIDARRAHHRDIVARFVVGEVLERLVPRRISMRATGHEPARQRAPLRRREQSQ